MQLNSITIMDFIAYGGAALGLIMAVTQYMAGHVTLSGCLLIILLSADFFIPMRQLGSYFHVAMNGMAASDKIFRLLDLPEPEQKSALCPENGPIICHGLSFAYRNIEEKEGEGIDEKKSESTGKKGCESADEKEREVLHGVDLTIPRGSFISVVGESGCGKSTLASILMGRNRGYQGSVTIGGVELREINEESLFQNVTYVSHHSYLFKGTVRDNLLMGRPDAADEELWRILEQINLADFLRSEKGLDTLLTEQGSNLSGGQRQRLALARALLHDSPVYIFDEATSNIDVESENEIMDQIHALEGKKTVILISHRLGNVTGSDRIYVMDDGRIAESGSHRELLEQNGAYRLLWNAQQSLENFGREAEA